MKKELEEALVKDFPHLYKDYGGDMTQTCMHWGFECGDGWEMLIRTLSEKLTKVSPDTVAAQVKAKFGGLRFYPTDRATSEGDDAISEAEDKSYKVCEVCGKPGEKRGGRWIRTLCDECNKPYLALA